MTQAKVGLLVNDFLVWPASNVSTPDRSAGLEHHILWPIDHPEAVADELENLAEAARKLWTEMWLLMTDCSSFTPENTALDTQLLLSALGDIDFSRMADVYIDWEHRLGARRIFETFIDLPSVSSYYSQKTCRKLIPRFSVRSLTAH